MLWTDDSSREFIAEHYPWFLDTFNDYKYNILRADAIRYFVLYHYGGVYLDLDIGCLRPVDPLLVYPVILPKTIPVGVSNDLMFAEKMHPFLAQTIHNLATFDHSWILNYPTVMFSTGPMFLSAQYGIFTSSHVPRGEVRILPKALYGKNAKEGEAPHSFFSHFYGSSWHADDAAFISFLLHWGKGLMWLGLMVLIVGLLYTMYPAKKRRHTLRRIGGYDVFPRRSSRTGRWHLHLRGISSTSSSSLPTSGTSTALPSPTCETEGGFDTDTDGDVPVLHLPFDVRPSSPASSEASAATSTHSGAPDHLLPVPPHSATDQFFDVVRRVRNRFAGPNSGDDYIRPEPPRTPVRPRDTRRQHRYTRGVMFFLPAIFTQAQDIELGGPPVYAQPVPRREYDREYEREPRREYEYEREYERFSDGLGLGIGEDEESHTDGVANAAAVGVGVSGGSRSRPPKIAVGPLVDLSDAP